MGARLQHGLELETLRLAFLGSQLRHRRVEGRDELVVGVSARRHGHDVAPHRAVGVDVLDVDRVADQRALGDEGIEQRLAVLVPQLLPLLRLPRLDQVRRHIQVALAGPGLPGAGDRPHVVVAVSRRGGERSRAGGRLHQLETGFLDAGVGRRRPPHAVCVAVCRVDDRLEGAPGDQRAGGGVLLEHRLGVLVEVFQVRAPLCTGNVPFGHEGVGLGRGGLGGGGSGRRQHRERREADE